MNAVNMKTRKMIRTCLAWTLAALSSMAMVARGEVRIGEAYRYLVGPYEVKMKNRSSATVKCERNFTSVAIEVLGCAGVNVTPVVVPENTAAKLVGVASVKTDAQMKALVYRSGHETEEGVATCTSGGKEYSWDASLWPDGEVNADRKWIVVPVSCTGSWGGLPSFSVRLKGLDIASDSYYIQTAQDAMPSINAKSIFGLVCKQLGGSSVSGFQFKVNGCAYSMYDEDCKGIAPWWMFDWNEWETESVSMTVNVPEAGLLAIRGIWPNGFGDMSDWAVWQISGDGVSEELARPNCYEAGAQLKINCSGATTVTLRNDVDDKFTMSDLAFFPASAKSVHIVGDFVVSRRVENASGEVSYPLYVNGYVTGGGTYKVDETVTMVAVAAPGMKCDHWEITDQDWWGDDASTISFPAGTDTTKATLSFVVPESFCGEMSDMKVVHVRPIFVEDSSGDGADAPIVVDDPEATVTGDAETGFIVKPSKDKEAIVVTIPSGVDAAKVTVVVAPDTQRVTPNGAAVRVLRGEADITDYLKIPEADALGVIDLNTATVREEIAKEPLDAAKGAVIDFASPSSPSFTTAPTREGLVYRLKEGATLEAMEANTTGDTKIGDGTSWTPTLSVTGGTSGFYTIQVTK